MLSNTPPLMQTCGIAYTGRPWTTGFPRQRRSSWTPRLPWRKRSTWCYGKSSNPPAPTHHRFRLHVLACRNNITNELSIQKLFYSLETPTLEFTPRNQSGAKQVLSYVLQMNRRASALLLGHSNHCFKCCNASWASIIQINIVVLRSICELFPWLFQEKVFIFMYIFCVAILFVCIYAIIYSVDY